MDEDNQITFIPATEEEMDWPPLNESLDDINDPLAEDLIPEVELKEEPEESEDDELFNEDDSNGDDNYIICDNIDEIKNSKKFSKNNNEEIIKVVVTPDKQKRGCPEVLPGIQKDSRIYHDGNGYYFRTNRKSQNVRYLRCIKVGCKARGQIADKAGSPIVLSFDAHNHRPLDLKEQAAKRAKAFGIPYVLPPTKRMNCYVKKKDGTFELVSLDAAKIPPDAYINKSICKITESEYKNFSLEASRSIYSEVLRMRNQTNGMSAKKLEIVELVQTITRSLKPILPRPDPKLSESIKPLQPSPFINSPQIIEGEHKLDTQSTNSKTLPSSTTDTNKSASDEQQQSEVLCDSKNIPVFYHDGKGYYYVLTLFRNNTRYLRCIKDSCKARGRMDAAAGAPISVMTDSHNHNPMTKDEQAHMKMKAKLKTTRSTDLSRTRNNNQEDGEKNITAERITSPLETLSFIQAQSSNIRNKIQVKGSSNCNDSDNEPSSSTDPENNNEIIPDRRSNVGSSVQDNVITIKEEPQEEFIDEVDNIEKEDEGVNNESENNYKSEKKNSNVEIVTSKTEIGFKKEPVDALGKNYKKANCDIKFDKVIISKSSKDAYNYEKDDLSEEVIIKEEQQADEYLSMTVDNDSSDEDDDYGEDLDNDNSIVIKEEIEDEVKSSDLSTSAPKSGANVDNKKDSSLKYPGTTMYQTIRPKPAISHPLKYPDTTTTYQTIRPKPVVSHPINVNEQLQSSQLPTASNNQAFTTAGQNNPRAMQLNPRAIQQKQNSKMIAPKNRSDSGNHPLITVPVQPQNIPFLGYPSAVPSSSHGSPQFTPNIQNSGVLQFNPENGTPNNQNVQLVQLNQNGGFVPYPGPNNNQFGYFVPANLLPMPQQQVQNNPFIPVIPPSMNSQQDKISSASQAVSTVQQNGQVFQIIQNGQQQQQQQQQQLQQNKVNPQTMSAVTGPDGTVYHIMQTNSNFSVPEKMNTPPQLQPQPVQAIQQNGQVFQLVQNDQGKNTNSPTICPTSFTSVQQNGQVFQMLQSDQGKIMSPQSISTIQQNGQIFQVVQGDQGRNGAPSTIQPIQQNNQVFQIMQNDQGKSRSQTISAIQQNGQIYQIVQNSQEKMTTSQPIQSIQQNGQIFQIVPSNQGKVTTIPSNVHPVQQTGPNIFQIVQKNNEGKIKNNKNASSGKNAYKIIQSGKDKVAIPQTDKPNGQVLRLLPNSKETGKSSRKLQLAQKIGRYQSRSVEETGNNSSAISPFQQNSQIFQILPSGEDKISSPQIISSPNGQIFQIMANEQNKLITSQPVSNLPNNQIVQLVQNEQNKINVSQSLPNLPNGQLLSAVHNNPFVQVGQGGHDKPVPQTIVGPNGQLYQLVQNEQNKATPPLPPPPPPPPPPANPQIIQVLQNNQDKVTTAGQIYQLVQTDQSKIRGGQVYQLLSNDQNKIISQPGVTVVNQIPSSQMNQIVTSSSNSNTPIAIAPQMAVSSTTSVNNFTVNSELKKMDYPVSVSQTSTASATPVMSTISQQPITSIPSALFTQAQNNFRPILTASSAQLPQQIIGDEKNNTIPNIISATVCDDSGQQSVASFIRISPSSVPVIRKKTFKPIAPAPASFKNDLIFLKDSIKKESRGAALYRPPSPITRKNCHVIPSEQLPGLNEDVLYHDGKGYYYFFQKMKYRNRNQHSDQKLLRCIRQSCRAIASMTAGEKNASIRHGLWYHNHDPLTPEQQLERKERLLAINRMKLRIRKEMNAPIQNIYKEEMEKFLKSVESSGYKPANVLLDEDICTLDEKEFVDTLLARELSKEEQETTIAMSVKKRPRSTINTKPIVDATDNIVDNEDDDENDANYGPSTSVVPRKRKKRGRPRKKNNMSGETETSTDSFQEIEGESIKSEVFDIMESNDESQVAKEKEMQICNENEMLQPVVSSLVLDKDVIQQDITLTEVS
ncbi:uncharacterized protein LOC142328918 [Lycorma delicatula]|uniref:uncharacterized protein LOC142328918 n=1 Tax=Lycorma delicatula TaxID=130591 RepID=UPI003F51898B